MAHFALVGVGFWGYSGGGNKERSAEADPTEVRGANPTRKQAEVVMPEITPTLIDDLVGRTGRPVSECKKALMEADGNIGKAIDWFRSRGAFPIRRETAEGRV